MSATTNGSLAADTAMGAVTLKVANLDAMTAYYRDAVALRVLDETNARVVLGRGTTPIVVLEHAPELKHASPRDAGLFHTAILFETEEALAAAVYSVATRHPTTFTGSADHLVSKAFYFTDPEGNGVELYWDRERSSWSWAHGTIEMGTLFLDPNGFLQREPHGGGNRRSGDRRRTGRTRSPSGRRRGERARVLRDPTRIRRDGGSTGRKRCS